MVKKIINSKETHVSDAKKKSVKELIDLLKRKTVLVISISKLPSAKLQEIKKQLRGRAEVRVTKKNLIQVAVDQMGGDELKKLVEHLKDNCAIIYSDEDAFELSAFLSSSKSPAKAKTGQIALEDIRIEAGPTSLIPGPDISALGAVGLKVKVEGGKLAIQAAHTVVKKGEKVSEAAAAILSKLDIMPFKIGAEPMVALSNGKLYTGVKVDKEAMLAELKSMFARAIAFAVSLNYPSGETIGHLLGKAASHEKALSSNLKEEIKTN